MIEIILCMILDINNGGSLVANCRPEYEPQTLDNVTLIVANIEAPINNQPFVEESKQNLAKLCLNKEAKVSVYTRNNQFIFGEVECDGNDIAALQVISGMARVDKHAWMRDQKISEKLLEYEQKAHGEKIGMWSKSAD